MKKRIYYFALTALLLILILIPGACRSAPASTSTSTSTTTTTTTPTPTKTTVYTINIMSNSDLGEYLFDGNGMTLYYFTKDAENKSNASDAVIVNWLVFYAAEINVPAALDAADFGTITRDNGDKQTTYKKWPLYYFVQDKAAGDVKGQGVIDS